MKYDSVIIGAGVSGLISALVLAKNGHKVAVVEKSKHVGPLLRRFKRGNVWCDPGLHYTGGFEESGALSVLFSYLGIRDLIQSVPMNSDGYDILCFDDTEIPLPVGMNKIRDTLCHYFPRSRDAIYQYVKEVDRHMESTPFFNFSIDFGDFSKDTYVTDSLTEYLKNIGAEENLIKLLGQYGQFLYGVGDYEVPFYIHALVMGSFYRSPQMLRHGGDDIIDAFEYGLRHYGVDIFCDRPAIGIEVDNDRRLKGVKISGEDILECSNCICTAHPGILRDILPSGSVRPAYLSRLKGLENTSAAFAVYLEVDDIPEKIAKTNLYRLASNGNYVESNMPLAVMACDPEIRDGKKKGLCVLKESTRLPVSKESYGVKKRTREYIEYKKKETELTVRQMEDFLPELKGKYTVVNSVTPFTYERYTGTPNGSMYGIKHSVNQIKLNSVTSIKGFYLAGQNILMPGVMGAAVSGFWGCSNILGINKIWSDVKKWL